MSMFARILILLDGSPGDRYALEYGIGLARGAGAETHIVGVIEIPTVSATIDEVKEVEDERRHAIDRALRAAREQAERAGQPITTEALIGPVVETVSRSIRARAIDLLVIGEALDGLDRDHRRLARKAPCPVFVARESVVQEFVGEPDHRTEHWRVRRDMRVRIEGAGRMLQIFVGEADRSAGRPVYELIVERLRQLDLAGATVFSGELGFGAAGHLHASSHRPWSHDRPQVVTVVDTTEAIQRAIAGTRDLVENGLIVTSDVEIIKYAHRSRAAADSIGASSR
jgi:PII-like signaling protein/nucleotide-binding universal stress UspA family protein